LHSQPSETHLPFISRTAGIVARAALLRIHALLNNGCGDERVFPARLGKPLM
jgi:hypothetical protein